jgi:hypothetical protein
MKKVTHTFSAKEGSKTLNELLKILLKIKSMEESA